VARFGSNPECPRGVAVTIPVEEGISYALSRVDWAGQQAISAEELNSLLSMKPGEVANGLKTDAGLKLIQRTYGKKGYIEASLKPEQVFDDPERLVAYRILVREGPQYRMGRIEFRGLSDSDAASLKRKWKLQPGDVFDTSYTDEFTKSSDFLRIRQKTGAKHVEITTNPEREQRIVDVTVTLKQER
jgi:outer membrane protein insertion porin family